MIFLRSKAEIEKIAVACRIVRDVLECLMKRIAPGMTTKELDSCAETEIRKRGGAPAFKGYLDYPASLCVSVNNEVVHGIPAKRVIKKGDIVGLDLGAIYDGFYGDAAVTVPIGPVSAEAIRLMKCTEEAMYLGIAQARVGKRLSDISHAIQSCAEGAGYSVVTAFVGHGIGRALHEEPQIPNFGPPGRGPRLREGMVLAIEPMVNIGKSDVRVLSDKWTAVTVDGTLSAHFEHTIAVTKGGPTILTQWSH